MKRLTFFMVAIMALCLTAIAQKQSSKTLVAYFSATGTTEKAAKVVAEVTSGTLYEIQPAKKYTSADLDWHDKSSRTGDQRLLKQCTAAAGQQKQHRILCR